jgi:hypothetical protein
VIVKQETKHKRNETKQAETKRNETRHNRNETKQAETKRNETRHNRNETKKNKKTSMNKKTKQTLTKRFFFTWDNNPQNISGGLKNL